MEYWQWVHPYDADGKRQDFAALPSRLQDLRDDPYRSLAGEVQRAEGFAKDTAPYSEFLWADYFRDKVSKALLGNHYVRATEAAMKLSHKQDTRYLPGWAGTIRSNWQRTLEQQSPRALV
jgi:hypothetical protein